MPTTTNAVIIDPLSLSHSLVAHDITVRGGSTPDVLTIYEGLFYTFVPDPHRVSASNAVTVAQAVAHDRTSDHGTSCTVGQSVGLHFSWLRKPTDTLTITESLIAYKPKASFVDPAAASYVGGLTPSITVPGVIGVAHPHQFRLSYSGTDCYLRNPSFGDKNSYQQTRVQRKSRGGDLQIKRIPTWPTTELLTMKFEYLDPTDAENLRAFMVMSLGQQIDLYDQYGRHWVGVLTQPGGKFTADKRATSSAELVFQGALA